METSTKKENKNLSNFEPIFQSDSILTEFISKEIIHTISNDQQAPTSKNAVELVNEVLKKVDDSNTNYNDNTVQIGKENDLNINENDKDKKDNKQTINPAFANKVYFTLTFKFLFRTVENLN